MNKISVRIISCLIPYKKWRKKFRAHFEKNNINVTNISLIELFLQQFDQAHSFNRYDTIVRLLAIENYYGLNNCGWNLYCKMQDSRKFKGYSIESKENFIKLIKSWEENGYDVNEIQLY